jgi:hypothetical protein
MITSRLVHDRWAHFYFQLTNPSHVSLLRHITEDRALIIEEIQQLPPFAAQQIPLLILLGVNINVFEFIIRVE